MKKLQSLVVLAVVVAMCGSVSAAVIVSDTFDYADGVVTGLNGGTGTWGSAYYPHDNNPTYAADVVGGKLSATGKKLTLRDIDSAPSTGQVWTSVLLQINSADGSLGTNDSAAFNFFDGGGVERTYVGYRQNYIKLQVQETGSTNRFSDTISYAPDQTAFVVTMIDFATESMYLWLNPTAPTIANADIALVGKTGNAYAIDKVRFGLESNEGAPNTLDNFFVGTTYADVVPEPTTMLLLGLGSLLGLRRKK